MAKTNGQKAVAPKLDHIITAMLAIQKEFSRIGIPKSHKNEQQNYDFRSIDDVMIGLSGLLAANSVLVKCNYDDRESQERVDVRTSKAVMYTRLRGQYIFKSAIDASEYGPVSAYGEGNDYSDKSTTKAMASAYKYMVTQNFCVPIRGVMVDADTVTIETVPKAAAKKVDAKSPLDDKYSKVPSPDAIRQMDLIIMDLEQTIKGCTTYTTAKQHVDQEVKQRVESANLSETERQVVREKAKAALAALKERLKTTQPVAV